MVAISPTKGEVLVRNKFNHGFDWDCKANEHIEDHIELDITYVFNGERTEELMGVLLDLEDAYACAASLLEAIRDLEQSMDLEPRDFTPYFD